MILRAIPIAGVLAGLATTLTAQHTGAFVVRLGVDTLGVERYSRSATELRGEQVLRAPRGVHRIYTVTYRADGSVERFELVTHYVDGRPGPTETRATAEYGPGGVAMRVPDGDSIASVTAAVPAPAAPWEINIYGLTEDVLRRARVAGRAEFAMPVVRLGSDAPDTATVRRLGGDSLLADFGGIGPFRIRSDSAGTLLGLSGVGGTLGVTVERVPALDIAAMGLALASRPLGVLSPADSVKVRIGRADLAVRYSRPTRRGRAIFGTAVPAGEYSLYSIPSATGWTLILNRNTGQWGTSYDERHDLARIPMAVAALPQPIERFTIAIEPAAEGGVLSLAWDRTRASVPITVR